MNSIARVVIISFCLVLGVLSLRVYKSSDGQLTIQYPDRVLPRYPLFISVDTKSSFIDIRWKFISVGNSYQTKKALDQGCVTAQGKYQTSCKGVVIAKSFNEEGTYKAVLTYQKNINIYLDISVEDFKYKNVTRKEFRQASYKEWIKFRNGLYLLKQLGIYDLIVSVHNQAMYQASNSSYPNCNVAHCGPSFLPWHRFYTRILEIALQDFKEDDKIYIPYWNWTQDQILPNGPLSSPLWTNKYLGGSGDTQNGHVLSGPFCSVKSNSCRGKWPVKVDLGGPYLLRNLGKFVSILPTPETVQNYLNINVYDNIPYNNQSYGFRAFIEGWKTFAHNSVHQFVGGTMTWYSSSNDPVFFLHHAFIEKLYVLWQEKYDCYEKCYNLNSTVDPNQVPTAVKTSNGYKIPNQGLDDYLWPWNITVRQVVNAENLGYNFK